MPKQLPMPVAAALAVLLIAAAPAAASSGETLSLRLAGPAVAGGATDFVASGVDSDESIGGYNLDVFAKPKALDPICAPTDDGEQQSWMADMSHEFHPVVGLVETIDPGSFSAASSRICLTPYCGSGLRTVPQTGRAPTSPTLG